MLYSFFFDDACMVLYGSRITSQYKFSMHFFTSSILEKLNFVNGIESKIKIKNTRKIFAFQYILVSFNTVRQVDSVSVFALIE